MRTVAILLLTMGAAGASDELWQYTHPGAQALIGVEWRRASDSYVGQRLRQELTRSARSTLPPLPGMELLEAAERVLVSSPGKRKGSTNEEPPIVVAMAGRFDRSRVRAAVQPGYVSSNYKGHELLGPARPKAGDWMLALVSDRILVGGDRASVRVVLDRLKAGAGVPANPLFDRAAAVAADNEIWAVLALPPDAFTAGGWPPTPLLQGVKGLDFGVALREGMALQFYLSTESEEAAGAMAMIARNLPAMMPSDKPEYRNLAKNLRVDTQGSTVRVSVVMDRAAVDQGFGQIRASMGGKSRSAGVQAAVRKREDGQLTDYAPVAAPPRKAVVRIYGMEGGTKEVPYQR